jgi:hypothetical protein
MWSFRVSRASAMKITHLIEFKNIKREVIDAGNYME